MLNYPVCDPGLQQVHDFHTFSGPELAAVPVGAVELSDAPTAPCLLYTSDAADE